MARLAVISDTAPLTTARLTRMLVEHDPGVLLFAGDHHPTRFGVSWRSMHAWRRAVGVPLKDNVIAVPGNHDFHAETGLQEWHRRFEPMWPRHVFREGGASWFLAHAWDVRIIGLDTGPFADGVSDEQLEWLEGLDPEKIKPPVIALAHSPLAAVSLHIGRAQDRDPERRDRLVAALHRLGVRLYLCGHEHLYAHRLITPPGGGEPIHQLTVGGGGATSYDVMTSDVVHSVSEAHVALVETARDEVVVTILGVRGDELDRVRVPAPAPRAQVRELKVRDAHRALAEAAAADERPAQTERPPAVPPPY